MKRKYANRIVNLEDKLKAQRSIKDSEKKRNEMRLNLYKTQDEVDNKKETLINDIEVCLKQKISKQELFWIKWKII
ncbi:hypothetical protein HY745_04040 [Candidatus Desantisbacteria bacterium]|nr:hypothetical protein [Candidatus Desantisbacteria bacterium]